MQVFKPIRFSKPYRFENKYPVFYKNTSNFIKTLKFMKNFMRNIVNFEG